MFNTSDEIQELAQCYGEMLGVRHFVESLNHLKQGRSIMEMHFYIFVWDIILREGTFFLIEGWISPELMKTLKASFNEMIKAAADKIDHII